MRAATQMVAAVAAAVSLAACEKETRDTNIRFVQAPEVRALYERASAGDGKLLVLIDPRPAKYFEHGHIPGAVNLGLARVPRGGTIDPTIADHKHIIVYGDNPASWDAKGMTKRLLEVGYDGVRWFSGGLYDWKRLGYPVEPPEPPAQSGDDAPAKP